MPHPATICAIDDNRDNLDLLEQELVDVGYRVVTATNGQEGLEVIARERPDLILLDVMMPGMNGDEVCRILRGDPTTAMLPIIMVTAKSSTHDEIYGLEAGANDYITKPINIDVLIARVRTHRRLKSLQDELRRSHEALMRVDKNRRNLTSMIAHDIKTPLMTVSAAAQLLIDPRTQSNPKKVAEIPNIICRSAQKMQELIEDSLSVLTWESAGMKPRLAVCDLRAEVTGTLEMLSPLIGDRDLTTRLDFPEEPALVFADPLLLRRVLQNLFSNAVKYNRSQGELIISVETTDDFLTCRVRDTGIGIPQQVLPRVFEAFYRTDDRRDIEGSGLGLAVVSAILVAHRAKFDISSTEGKGTEFVFKLPRAASHDATPPELTPAPADEKP